MVTVGVPAKAGYHSRNASREFRWMDPDALDAPPRK
jgi:hypothetical protein